jgi:hypothetical protein
MFDANLRLFWKTLPNQTEVNLQSPPPPCMFHAPLTEFFKQKKSEAHSVQTVSFKLNHWVIERLRRTQI